MVLRTNPGVIVPPDWGWQLTVGPDDEQQIRIAAFTRYEDIDSLVSIPRLLFWVVDLSAECLDEAATEALGHTSGLTTMMAFVGNCHVDSPELHVAYDVTGDNADHEFTQAYLPEHSSLPQPAAWLDLEAFNALHDRLADGGYNPRLGLALAQYNEALRSLRPVGGVLAAEHLFMAAEALVDLVKRRKMHAHGCADEVELAQYLGLDTTVTWKVHNALCSYLRQQVIFAADEEVHRALKKASDGFEHGFLPTTAIRGHVDADGILVAAFRYVRNSILDLLDLATPIRDSLAATLPTYNDRYHAVVRGLVSGESDRTEDPKRFKELNFTLNPTGAHAENEELRLTLSAAVDTSFSDGTELRDHNIWVYRNRLGEVDGEGST